jgi:hypothetical protein
MADIFNPNSATKWGLEFAPDNTASDVGNSATYYWAGMIKPTVSKNVTSLQFAHWSHVGAFQAMTVELQTDNGSGQPSGTVLQSGTVTPSANFTWESVTITSQAVTAGTKYHVVLHSANWSGTNSIELRRIDDPDTLFANVMRVNISTNSGSTYSNQGAWLGCVGLGYSDATFEGCGYGDFDTYNINNTNNQWGEYFQVPTTTVVNAFSSKVYTSAAGTPTADLTFVLMNADTVTTLVTGTVVTAATVTTTATWYTSPTFAKVTLTPGVNYRVYMTSAATASPMYTFRPPKTTATGNANAMTFGGTLDIQANNNSGTYQTDSAHDTPLTFVITTSSNLMMMGV